MLKKYYFLQLEKRKEILYETGIPDFGTHEIYSII
jgi:hypothetical protein